MRNGVIIDNNEHKIMQVVEVILHTVDRVVNSNSDGILAKPTTGAGLEEFRETVNEVVINKIRNKLGV